MAQLLKTNFYRLLTGFSILFTVFGLGGPWACTGSTGLNVSSPSAPPTEAPPHPSANAGTPPSEILTTTPEAGSIMPQFYRTHAFVFSNEKNGSFMVVSAIPKIGEPLFDSGRVKALSIDANGAYKEEECLGCERQIVRVVDCGPSWKEDTEKLIASFPPEEQYKGLGGSLAFLIFIGHPEYAKKICPSPQYRDFVIPDLDPTVSLKSLNVPMGSMLLFTLLPKYPDFQKFGEGSPKAFKAFDTYEQFSATQKEAVFLRGVFVHLLNLFPSP